MGVGLLQSRSPGAKEPHLFTVMMSRAMLKIQLTRHFNRQAQRLGFKKKKKRFCGFVHGKAGTPQ